jgi:hypothetical protein
MDLLKFMEHLNKFSAKIKFYRVEKISIIVIGYTQRTICFNSILFCFFLACTVSIVTVLASTEATKQCPHTSQPCPSPASQPTSATNV